MKKIIIYTLLGTALCFSITSTVTYAQSRPPAPGAGQPPPPGGGGGRPPGGVPPNGGHRPPPHGGHHPGHYPGHHPPHYGPPPAYYPPPVYYPPAYYPPAFGYYPPALGYPPPAYYPPPPILAPPPYPAQIPPPYFPGWFAGSPWDGGNSWRPDWFLRDLLFPQFSWMGPRAPGLWQCNSFVYSPAQNMWWSFYGTGPNQDAAAFNALFACGGHNFMQNGCYIPPGYCRL